MADRGEHCPFLNRADPRCGEKFSLDALSHALACCFDRYAACPVYHELLLERRQKRSAQRIAQVHHARQRLVQISIASRAFPGDDHVSVGAAVPALSGV